MTAMIYAASLTRNGARRTPIPTYNFLNTETNEEFQLFLRMSECDDYLEENPNIHKLPSAPAIISGTGASGPKTDAGFKDVLKQISKGAPRNNMKL